MAILLATAYPGELVLVALANRRCSLPSGSDWGVGELEIWGGVVKPRLLAFLAFVTSLGFGYWLIATSHGSRELYLCLVAWLLGFWLASGLRRSPSAEEPEDDDEWEEWDDEEDEDA
jgi:hypothetical protein